MHPPPPLALLEGVVDACYIPFSPFPFPPKKEGKGREGGMGREGRIHMGKKVVAITTVKDLWLVYHVYLSYAWSFMHCNINGTAFHTPPSRPA